MTMRVATWNLWARFGPWETRQAAIAAVLDDVGADIWCFQECWATDDGTDQAQLLAEPFGYHHARTPPRYWSGVTMGNAIISRWPLHDVVSTALPGADGAPGHRSALSAVIDAPVGPVTVVSTHLDHRYDACATRVAQATALAHLVTDRRGDPATAFPVVIGADLNATPDSDEVRLLTGRHPGAPPDLVLHDCWEQRGDRSPGHTWTATNPYLADATWPNRRLDYLLVSWPRPRPLGNPVRCWLAGDAVTGVQPSDHLAVVADLCTDDTER